MKMYSMKILLYFGPDRKKDNNLYDTRKINSKYCDLLYHLPSNSRQGTEVNLYLGMKIASE